MDPGREAAAGALDLRLVEAARQGDVPAFEELFKKYRNRVYRLVMGLIRDPHAALDVTQETFVQMHRALPRFEGRCSFAAWLFRIAVNRAHDHYRRERRHPTVALEEQLPDGDHADDPVRPQKLASWGPGARPDDPVAEASRREVSRRVAQAVGQLPLKARVTVILTAFGGLTCREAADSLGCSVGTVMSRLFYARKKLRDLLPDFEADMGSGGSAGGGDSDESEEAEGPAAAGAEHEADEGGSGGGGKGEPGEGPRRGKRGQRAAAR